MDCKPNSFENDAANQMPTLSMVVPCYNESEVLPFFYERTTKVVESCNIDYEIIFINDGSEDQTLDIISTLCKNNQRVKLIDLSRNFGKEIAMTAGIDFACGDAVILIDADLQDPPELIPDMISYWRNGYDVVYATRIKRDGETYFKKISAQAFYWLIARLSNVRIPENTGDYRLMSRRAIEAVKQFQEQHRFMKGLFSWIGYRQVSIPYHRAPRLAGSTKWNYWRLWNFAIEGITSFSYGPLRVASYLGIVTAFFAIGYATILIMKVIIRGRDVPGYASIMVTMLFLGAVQLITLGIIGEYLGRIFNEVKRRPLYLVQQLSGITPSPGFNTSKRTVSSMPKCCQMNDNNR
jgi:glycosyltransferase involved in cell wall biosynthesis